MKAEPASIAKLKKRRLEVLWWEFCSILHDIGKLSYDFHDYRQNWWWIGWGEDPHDHNWLDADGLIPAKLNEFFRNPIPGVEAKCGGTLSVIEAVHQHTNWKSTNRLIEILRIGDSTDSRYDRNNPLISNEQSSWDKQLQPAYRSNVYGHESKVELASLDRTRKTFYEELEKLIGTYATSLEDYHAFKELCRKYFEGAMSDTTRPSNDTALWEHVYGVTCVSKAVHAEDVSKEDLQLERWMPFDLYGVGVDTWKWCGQGYKIGDVTARKELIEARFAAVKQLIEFDVAAGNCIYEDDGFQVYLIGRLESKDGEVKKWLDEQVAACFGDELGAATVLLENVNSTTGVVRVIDALRENVATPSNWQTRRMVKGGQDDSDLCPVCRIRQIGSKEENRGVCGSCSKRRTRIKGFDANRDPKAGDETPMLGEIADKNGRVALVVARFGLREWLSGQMVRSCLITEPDGIERLGEILSKVMIDKLAEEDAAGFQDWLNKTPGRGYDEFRAELEEAMKPGADRSYALSVFARSPVGLLELRTGTSEAQKTWDSDLAEFNTDCHWLGGAWTKVDRLLNAVCAKTPTPSTTLDVWTTTKEFFEHAVKGDGAWIRGCLQEGARGWMEIEPIPHWLKHAQRRTIEIKGLGAEFLFHEGRIWIVQNQGKAPKEGDWIELIGDSEKERTKKDVLVTYVSTAEKAHSYWPYRTLTASPDVLMALMPADKATEFTRLLTAKYREHFGKVAGRLPLGIANIFFPKHLPMFSVLDTAWRVVDNFRRLQEGPWVERAYARLDKPKTGREACPTSALRLGNGKRDSFHSHVITKHRACVKSAFRTAAGWIAHREDLAEGTTILERPNLYDGIVLGGSGDRLNLNLTGDLDNKESPEERTVLLESEAAEKLFARTGEQRVGLMTLEEFEECRVLWDSLRVSGVGDGRMRNFLFALESRRTSWTGADRAGGEAAFLEIGKTLGRHYLGEDWERLEPDFERGLLEKTLRLHWAILKERLDD